MSSLDAAVKALARGELVVYPTDTLWGLAATATDKKAVATLFAAKERPPDSPVSIALSSLEEIETYAQLGPGERAFLRRELPGPITVLVRPSPLAITKLPAQITGVGRSIGLRIPDHPVARELAGRAGPITCTSANVHGHPNPADLTGVKADLGRKVAVYLDGEPAPSGQPSRVVDLTASVPTVVRE